MHNITNYLELLSALFWQNPWAQCVGLIALVIGVTAFVQKHDDHLRRYLTLYTLLMGLQFMLLGLWAGAFAAWLGTLRTYISLHTKNIWVMSIFLGIFWLITFPRADQLADYLAIAGTSVGTWAMFREHGLRMRCLMFIGTLCWLSHNFMVGSIGGTLIEMIFLLVNGRTMFRLFRQQSEAPEALSIKR